MLGGQDPLDGLSAYKAESPFPHWHIVTFGFSELYEKESENPDYSGYGFELTFRLRGKVNYTDIALHLMPKFFTLTELQQVYEVITDKELLKAAFRRKVADLVAETDHYTENAGHRPSRLYRRNWRIDDDL